MPKLLARKSNQPAGWVCVPEGQNFDWALRLKVSSRSSVTVPVRVRTENRGWTQYFFADLDGLTEAQLRELAANNLFEPSLSAA